MTQQRSAFGGGGFFGKPVKLAPQTSPLGQPQSVGQQGMTQAKAPSPRAPIVQAAGPAQQSQALPFQAAPAAPAPSPSFQSKRVPMGNPGDCPICH